MLGITTAYNSKLFTVQTHTDQGRKLCWKWLTTTSIPYREPDRYGTNNRYDRSTPATIVYTTTRINDTG